VNGAGEVAASELGGFAALAPPVAPPVDRDGLAPVAATKVAVGTAASVSVPPAAIGEPGKGFVAAVRRMFGLPELATPDELPGEPRRSLFDYSPAWLVSLIFHLIVLMALALFVTPVGEGLNNLLLTIGQSDVESVGEFAEFSIGEEMEVDDPTDAMTLDSLAEVDALEMADLQLDTSSPEFVAIEEGLGSEILPVASMFVGRSGAMRKTLLSMYGGTSATEDAVKLGLKWLQRQQGKDGSWSLRGPYNDGASGENRVAATAMALLAFLGDGQTHLQGDYQATVAKGIKWLVKQQDRDGFFAKEGQSHQRTYAQAQSSIVVCELYGMTEDSWLRDPAQLALSFAERAQGPDGGWRYNPGDPGDTSVTGWYVMALQSGVAAGLDVDQSTLYKVREFLNRVGNGDGSEYSYQPSGVSSAAMTAEGLLCRQYLGWERDEPGLIRGVNRLVSDDWIFAREDNNVYYWYYATQVLHHFGDEPWRQWNEVMRQELPAMQVKEGREAGSWAPQRDRWASVSGGRLMMTCFSIYCLEVYYRHMPLYQAGQKEERVSGR
jgi:hypothetical protein